MVNVYAVDSPASRISLPPPTVLLTPAIVSATSPRTARTRRWCLGLLGRRAVIGYISRGHNAGRLHPPAGISGPLPPGIADHVVRWPYWKAIERVPEQHRQGRAADHGRSPLLGKTIDLCIPEDPICSPAGNDNGAHTLYAANSMTHAAAFAAGRVWSAATGPSADMVRDDAGPPAGARRVPEPVTDGPGYCAARQSTP